MKIGEAAKETGLSVSNIRFYEKKGLLNPRRREESQYREYEQEEVRRLKEIMLLRKLGISIESIYLLYNGQAEYQGLLRRQREALSEQMEMLRGSLELCRILEGEGTLQELDVDQWLFWVRREEESGKKFAAAEEFLEDMAEFSRLASFRYDPYVGRFFRKRGSTGMLALLLFLFLLAAVASVILRGSGAMGRQAVIGFWLFWFLGLGVNFCRYRRRRQKEREEAEECIR